MGGYAWVTLATNDSYSLGALVLAHSLKQVRTEQQLAVLITPGVTEPMRTKLREVFNVVREVNVLDSRDEANLRLLKRPELGITFTKLHCWRLTQYDKCVFLDADTLVLENCDELFEREELSAAPDIGWPDCFNSGVFVYRPSDETYEKLIQFALDKGSFDGGDQGLLNQFFSDWAHKDISKHLPFIYNMASTACYSYLPAFKQFGANAKIIHFIGATKPWLQYFDTETSSVRPTDEVRHLQEILQRWWNIFCSLIHPGLTPDMNIPSPTDTVHGSQSNNSQNIIHTSYYYHHENTPAPDVSNPAENYQHVWDPWEEYDSRQLNNQQCESNENNIVHNSESHSEPSSHDNYQQVVQTHSHSNVNEFQSHHVESHSHSNIIETHIPERHTHAAEHQSQYHNPPHSDHNKQSELVEPHNTNASIDARHDHCFQPPTPTYSQLHTPTVAHYDPPECHVQEAHQTEPPPVPHSESCPRLPDECVATTTVSNEISLHTGSNEDRYEDDAGIAGAFARLTLGVKRTPEQEALEDHLRRQGWEIGNIDYLGRDSFENIWSKICETITSDGSPAPPPQPSVPAPTFEQPKEPSPPKTAVELTKETAPVEPEKIVQPEQETPIIESPITKLSESKPQDDIRKTTEIPKEVSEPVSTILKSVQPTEFLESEPLKTILDPCISGKPASLTSPAQTPATLSQLPASPSPTPISTAISAIVSTLEAKSTSPSPVPDSTSTAPDPATLSPVPKTPSPEPTTPTPVFTSPEYMLWSPVSVSPLAVPTCQSSSPASPSPVPASPSPVAVSPSPAPASPSPAPTSPSPAPTSPSPAPPSPSPAPASPSPAPPSPSPASTNSEPVPSPVLDLAVSTTTPTNLSDISVSSLSTVTTTPTAAVPEITTPSPVSPAPLPQKPSSIIITASPISKPTYPSPIPTAPISEAPTATRESPISVCPAPILRKQASAPEKQTTVTPDVQSLASAPEIPSLASAQAQPHSVSKQPPKEDACIILAKSGSEVSECSVPSKKSAKKSKESVTIPKAEVTEATPPATPVFQPPKIGKQTLGAKQSVPDTPPPTESSTGPTPPPRKSSGGTKKATGKGKK